MNDTVLFVTIMQAAEAIAALSNKMHDRCRCLMCARNKMDAQDLVKEDVTDSI